jgi:hypothetical protein
MRQVIRVPVAALLSAFVACTGGSGIRDSFKTADFRMPFDQRLRIEIAAPVIVLGRVLKVDTVGEPHASPGDARIKTQLTRIQIAVEQLIKGNVRSNGIEFYYFTYSTDNHVDFGVPRYIPNVGQRRIYFLQPWKTTYRSIGDVTDYTLRVDSGRHPREFCRGEPPGCCIAEILLTPGVGVDPHYFTPALIKADYVAKILCSPARAQQLVERLTKYPNRQVANRAREILTFQ